MIFAGKMPEFYVIIARKIFFPKFGGHVPPLPPMPMISEGKRVRVRILVGDGGI